MATESTPLSPRAVRVKPTVAALLIAMLIVQIEVNVVGTAMPDISAELNNFSLYPWVFAGYLVAYTATVPLFGMLNDVFGRKTSYLVGLAFIAGGSALCGLSNSMEMLIVGRLIQGSGAGALFVSSQTILGDLFSIEQRARMQSALALVGAIGSTAGPALGGWIVTYTSWRWAFLITLPVVAITMAFFLHGFVDSTKRGTQPINWRGSLLLTAILSALLLGIGKGDANPTLLALAVALAIPFVLLERGAARPVLPPDLFANRAFRLSAMTLFFVGAVSVSYIAFLPLYLQGVAGMAPRDSGYLQAIPMTVVATGSAFFVGKFIKRHGFRPALRLGAFCALCATLATALAAWLHAGATGGIVPAALVALAQGLMGLCWGFAMTAAIICVQNQVTQARRGAATASAHLVRGIGNVLAPAILGYLLLVALRDQHLGIPPEQFLNQKTWSELDPAALTAARAGLGVAVRSLLPVLVGLGLLAFITTLFFPKAIADVDAKKPA